MLALQEPITAMKARQIQALVKAALAALIKIKQVKLVVNPAPK